MVQYRETDWQFIKRMAGCMGLGVYCDESVEGMGINIGLSATGTKADFDAATYQSKVDEAYYHGWREEGIPKVEFLYYQVESYRNYTIGDYAYYKGQKRYIFRKEAEWKDGVLLFRYRLGGEYRFRKRKEYNRRLAGLSLAGKIIKTEKETVYIRLDIDGNEGKAVFLIHGSLFRAMCCTACRRTGQEDTFIFLTTERKRHL